jgi:hypothetical protein
MILADDLRQRGRAHPHRERRCRGQPLLGALLDLRSEQTVVEKSFVTRAVACHAVICPVTGHIVTVPPTAD